MKHKSKSEKELPVEEKYYKIVMIVGVVVAILIACMPWMGTQGVADPKVAGTGGLWVNFLGRFHPLLLHLPIGALMLVFCMEGLGLVTRGKYQAKTTLAVGFAAVTAVLAVVLGYFWYLTGEYNSETVEEHKRDGVIFTVLMIVTFLVKYSIDVKGVQRLKCSYIPLLLITSITMIAAGHHGGEISHGNPMKYLPSEIQKSREAKLNEPAITDPVIYTSIVHPIIDNKCVSCHGEDKQKGDLRMDSMAWLLEGGAEEICLEPGDVKESFMMTTIDLPLDDDLHMPPEDKPQITPAEREILAWWIKIGAPEKKKLSEVEVPADIRTAIDSVLK